MLFLDCFCSWYDCTYSAALECVQKSWFIVQRLFLTAGHVVPSFFLKIFIWFVVSWNCTMFDNFNDKFHTLFRRMSSNVITNCNCNCNGQNLARKVSKVAFWVGMHDFLHCDWKKKSISSQENSRNTKMRGNFVVYFLWLKKPIIYKTSVSRKIAWQFFSEFRLRFQSSSANHSESLRHS